MQRKSKCKPGNERDEIARCLEDNAIEILERWEHKLRERVPETRKTTSFFLRNHIPEVIKNLSDHLYGDGSGEYMEKTLQIGKLHGGQRADFAGYDLSQVLVEYQILRQVIFDCLCEVRGEVSVGLTGEILDILNRGVQNAASRFLEQRSEELRRSNRDLEHFAAVAAHDLKSPLATISGYMELLSDCLEEKGIGVDEKEYIEAVKRSAARMSLLIDRLLQYATLGQEHIQFHAVSLTDVVQKVMENLKMEIDENRARVLYQALPEIDGDEALLILLFQNLIHNAIKFRGDRSPEIKITFREEGECWLISVRDNGVGFDIEKKQSIFGLFSKMHEKNQTGAGIGLATCRKIVELHGGKIWAESEKGKGSVFHFTLPKRHATK